MKTRLLSVLLLASFLFISCGPHKPPQPPPEPSAYCGDGICELGLETYSCTEDCGLPPAPPPPPPPEKRPVKKDKKDLLIGYYGIGSGAGMDVKKVAKDIYDSPDVNGLDIHGPGAIFQNNVMPWNADMTDNETYYESLDALIAALDWYSLTLEWDFHHQYQDDGKVKDYIAKLGIQNDTPPKPRVHPLNKYFGSDLRKLYNAFDYGKKQNTWFRCEEEKKIETCHVLPGYEFMERYFDRTLAIFAKYKHVRYLFRTFNEQRCTIVLWTDKTAHCLAGSSTVGEFDQIQLYVERKAKALGIRGKWISDFTPFMNGKIYYPNFKKSYSAALDHGWLKEVHHCDADLLEEMKKEGIDLSKIVCSDDGNPDGSTTAANEIRENVNSGTVAAGDMKLGSADVTAWSINDLQKNWDEIAVQLLEKQR